MASEDVCILLNERESAKAKAAESLLLKFKEHNITASRITADAKIEKTLKQRSPKIVILDYVIGDFTTGLDLLSSFADLDDRPEFIFLTDEPSVPVAVDALRLGAKNYIELHNPEATNIILEETKAILKQRTPRLRAAPVKERLKFKNFIAQSKSTISLINQARAHLLSKSPLTIILGPKGAGRSALAEAMQLERNSTAFCRSLNWDLYHRDINELTGIKTVDNKSLKLGLNLSLILDHVSSGYTNLLEFIEGNLKDYWSSRDLTANDSFLTICTEDEGCAKAWHNIFEVPILTMPSLSERKEDLPALARHFQSEASSLSGSKMTALNNDILGKLSDFNWIGNVKQLRAVTIDACLISHTSEQEIEDMVRESYERSLEYFKEPTSNSLEPYTIASMIEHCDGDIRVAAASLGISITQVKSILKLPSSVDSSQPRSS